MSPLQKYIRVANPLLLSIKPPVHVGAQHLINSGIEVTFSLIVILISDFPLAISKLGDDSRFPSRGDVNESKPDTLLGERFRSASPPSGDCTRRRFGDDVLSEPPRQNSKLLLLLLPRERND